MKIIFGFMCFLAVTLTEPVSATRIKCYLCMTEDEAGKKAEDLLPGYPIPDYAVDCAKPINQSQTTEIDSTKYSCYKLVETVNTYEPNSMTRKTIVNVARHKFEKNACPMLLKMALNSSSEFIKEKLKVQVEGIDVQCYECGTDTCNSGDSLKIMSGILFLVALICKIF